MTPEEALALCRLAKACCPSQALDEFTPEAWGLVLEPYRYEDAKQAVVDVVREKPFVSPSEIIARVKQIRTERIRAFGPFDPPDGLTPREYGGWLGQTTRQIADGTLTRDQYQGWEALPPREMPELGGMFRHVKDDDEPEEAS